MAMMVASELPKIQPSCANAKLADTRPQAKVTSLPPLSPPLSPDKDRVCEVFQGSEDDLSEFSMSTKDNRSEDSSVQGHRLGRKGSSADISDADELVERQISPQDLTHEDLSQAVKMLNAPTGQIRRMMRSLNRIGASKFSSEPSTSSEFSPKAPADKRKKFASQPARPDELEVGTCSKSVTGSFRNSRASAMITQQPLLGYPAPEPESPALRGILFSRTFTPYGSLVDEAFSRCL
jgi:hypothetical protein